MTDFEPSRSIKTAETIFEILEVLRRTNGGRVTEVAKEMDMAKSTIYNYLNTLRKYDFVVKEKQTYYIGLRFFDYGGYARRNIAASCVGQPVFEHLAVKTSETIWLLVKENDYVVYVNEVLGESAGVPEGRLGVRVPLLSTAAGQLIYERLPERQQRAIQGDTETGAPSDRGQDSDMEIEHHREFKIKDDPLISGIKTLSTPVVVKEDVYGSISIAAPAERMRRKITQGEIIEQLVEATNILEVKIQSHEVESSRT